MLWWAINNAHPPILELAISRADKLGLSSKDLDGLMEAFGGMSRLSLACTYGDDRIMKQLLPICGISRPSRKTGRTPCMKLPQVT